MICWIFWTFFWTFYLNHLSPLWRPNGDNMETTRGQHQDNVKTTWGPQECGDHMGTTGDHMDVETMWGQHGDNMGTTWGPQGCGDCMGTL